MDFVEMKVKGKFSDRTQTPQSRISIIYYGGDD